MLTRPDIVETVHRTYLDTGCDIVETNTFGATPLVLNEYDLGVTKSMHEINRQAALIARKICAEYPGKTRFVAGSLGPTTKSLSLTGGISFDDLVNHYGFEQVRGLLRRRRGLFFDRDLQHDGRNVKAAFLAIAPIV